MRAFARVLIAAVVALTTLIVLGATVLTASALDRHFTYGQILALLIPPTLAILAVVLTAWLFRAYRRWDQQQQASQQPEGAYR